MRLDTLSTIAAIRPRHLFYLDFPALVPVSIKDNDDIRKTNIKAQFNSGMWTGFAPFLTNPSHIKLQHYDGTFMTDKQTMTGFALTGVFLCILFIIALFLEEHNAKIFLEERGVVESATVIFYFLCAVFIIYKGKLNYLKRYYYIFLLIIFCMLREMDFHKRFTTMGIFKTKFFLNSYTPFFEKFIGAVVIVVLLYFLYLMLSRHFKDFYDGLKNRYIISFGALIVAIFLGASKSIDGISRKFDMLSVEIGEKITFYAWAAEEILELGIPIILLLTYMAYFGRSGNGYDI